MEGQWRFSYPETLDSKTAENEDESYIVVMHGNRISGEPTGIYIGDCPNIFNSFKETSETDTDRVLTIIFGPEGKCIEITGNEGE